MFDDIGVYGLNSIDIIFNQSESVFLPWLSLRTRGHGWFYMLTQLGYGTQSFNQIPILLLQVLL